MTTCGTGGWTGPQPGDPDNNITLTATPAFGGIDITYSFPTVNPHAVAYVTLYRATSNSFGASINRGIISGNFFYDKVNSNQQYWYWIRVTSVYGTPGDLIGPATATARPLIVDLIEELTGEIDSGLLATSLKESIDAIPLLRSDLQAGILDMQGTNTSLAQAIQNVADGVANALTFIGTETTNRISATSAFASQLSVVAATAGSNLAAVQSLVTTSIDSQNAALTVMSQRIDEVYAGSGDAAAIALIRTDMEALINVVDDRVDSLTSTVTTNQSTAGTNLASVQTTLQTNINTVNGRVTNIGALYTAQVQVNGLIGGFGIYNDGTTVEAGFDVDRFWIGRTGATSRKPFIVEGGLVLIDEAAINKLTFTKLRDEAGTVMVESGKIKANYISIKGLDVVNAAGTVILSAGSTLNSQVTAIGGVAVDTVLARTTNGPNLIRDPELANAANADTDTAGWTYIPSGTPTVGQVRRLTTYPAEGPTWNKNAPAFYGGANSINEYAMWETKDFFEVNSASDYTLAVWARQFNASEARVYFGLLCYNSAGALTSPSAVYLSNMQFDAITQTWTRYSGVFGTGGTAFPTGTVKVKVRWFGAYNSASSTYTGSTLATRFTFNEGTVATTNYAPFDPSLAAAAVDFNAGNNQNASAIAVPTLSGTTSTIIEDTTNTDGSSNLSFDWIWGGSEADIDGFEIYLRRSTSSLDYTMSTGGTDVVSYNVPANKRSFILYGVPSTSFYTFAVRAYRRVNQSVNASGIIRSTLVQYPLTTDTPYRPSTTVDFAGDITGTVAGTAATTVVAGAADGTTALSAVNNTTTGLDARLRSNAADVLGGSVSFDAVTGGGFKAGTITWNTAGTRTSGYGVAMTAKGIVGFNSSNKQTFGISATTGDAVFGGTLTADAIDAVDTINIAGEAVTIPRYQFAAGNSASVTIVVPTGKGGATMAAIGAISAPRSGYGQYLTVTSTPGGVTTLRNESVVGGSIPAMNGAMSLGVGSHVIRVYSDDPTAFNAFVYAQYTMK